MLDQKTVKQTVESALKEHFRDVHISKVMVKFEDDFDAQPIIRVAVTTSPYIENSLNWWGGVSAVQNALRSKGEERFIFIDRRRQPSQSKKAFATKVKSQ